MKRLLFISLALLVLMGTTLACSLGGKDKVETLPAPAEPPAAAPTQPPAAAPTQPPAVEPTAPPALEQPTSEFPLMDDARNLTIMGGATNYQTSKSLKDILAFYREAFTKQGLKEREITTVISEQMFSIVFDGSANGKSLVVQAVVLDAENVNVNVRYE